MDINITPEASEKLIELIKRHEGYSRLPYYDTTGHFTIGYGRNLSDMGISDIEAEYLLKNDISDASIYCSAFTFWNNLNDARKVVLIDMCFNLGYKGLCTFKMFFSAIERNDHDAAAGEMLDSKWARQVGNRANELAEIWRRGEF